MVKNGDKWEEYWNLSNKYDILLNILYIQKNKNSKIKYKSFYEA